MCSNPAPLLPSSKKHRDDRPGSPTGVNPQKDRARKRFGGEEEEEGRGSAKGWPGGLVSGKNVPGDGVRCIIQTYRVRKRPPDVEREEREKESGEEGGGGEGGSTGR